MVRILFTPHCVLSQYSSQSGKMQSALKVMTMTMPLRRKNQERKPQVREANWSLCLKKSCVTLKYHSNPGEEKENYLTNLI